MATANSYLGIPREQIAWFPIIDPNACSACGECADLCANEVFGLNASNSLMEVVNPYNCVVLCDKCGLTCPSEAIHFPDKRDMKAAIQQLLAEHRLLR